MTRTATLCACIHIWSMCAVDLKDAVNYEYSQVMGKTMLTALHCSESITKDIVVSFHNYLKCACLERRQTCGRIYICRTTIKNTPCVTHGSITQMCVCAITCLNNHGLSPFAFSMDARPAGITLQHQQLSIIFIQFSYHQLAHPRYYD